ncbi:Hsp70 family protein [Terricaulis silvestris]|uniref:Hsp70 family protein n=1 Tax=Terricaulis silvestris TaxID=2686094 RepID=A0A6I6ML40_9CAUL|nr:Hsp70 family protein [Terricaulis silvestris]QGZ93367.1 hypothetical protein DSM104635_00177 [Terricaulis silvestris]
MSDVAEQVQTGALWRTCVDLGTSASKVSVCARAQDGRGPFLHPLKIGSFTGEPNPYLVQSAMLFDRDRIHFGIRATEAASHEECISELLQSFKMFLAARDVEESLSLKLKRTTDPSNLFTQRDALTLYTAYVLSLTERAIKREPRLSNDAHISQRRYAYPIWGPDTKANAVVARLFDEAQAIVTELGGDLVEADSLAFEVARASLDRARSKPGFGRVEAGVFEAQAASECHFAFATEIPEFVLVFDMGAGTTDFASFRRAGDGAARHLEEILVARRTLALGCDEIDNVLVAMFIDKTPKASPASVKRAFWKRLKVRARQLKETLFREGVCHATSQGKKMTIRLNDLYRDKGFRDFKASLRGAYQDCLSRVLREALAAGAQRVDVIPAGGGAMLPFVQNMLSSPGATLRGQMRLRVHPNIPGWIENGDDADRLGPIFPQLAVSLGGAIAPLRPSEAHF